MSATQSYFRIDINKECIPGVVSGPARHAGLQEANEIIESE